MAFMMKRAKQKAEGRIAMLTPRTRVAGVTLGLLLTLMFWGGLLLQCGDVEQNPGPTRGDSLKQSRLSTTGSKSTSDRAGTTPASSQAAPSPQQLTLEDLMEMMQTMNTTMNSKFEDVEQNFKGLRQQVAGLEEGFKDLREEVGALRKENEQLARTNSELLARIEQLERKTDDLEGRSKRNNLLFYGLTRDQNETKEGCEGKVKNLIKDKLSIDHDIQFDRVHRLNGKPDSPIIARCCFYKDKVTLLKAKRNLQGSNIFIGEDFSLRVREIRRKLSSHLKAARNDGKKASMVFDHLFIEGRKYVLDDCDQLKESR